MSEQPRITVWWCDICGYWRKDQSSGVHQTWGYRRGKMVIHPLQPVVFEMVPPLPVRAGLPQEPPE